MDSDQATGRLDFVCPGPSQVTATTRYFKLMPKNLRGEDQIVSIHFSSGDGMDSTYTLKKQKKASMQCH